MLLLYMDNDGCVQSDLCCHCCTQCKNPFLMQPIIKVNGYTYTGGNSVKTFCLPSEKGSTQKGKNLLPLGANSFLLELTPIRNGVDVQESKQEVTEIAYLAKNGLKSTKNIQSSLYHYYHLKCWVNISDSILKYFSFSFFSRKLGDNLHAFFSRKLGDNLREMLNPFFWKKKKQHKKQHTNKKLSFI